MSTYSVTAKKWDHGWELHIENEGVTQSRSLATAEQQVRDYLETVHDDLDMSDVEVIIRPDLPKDLAEFVLETVIRRRLADEAADEASAAARTAARRLRSDAGLSIADTAAVMGVSKTRALQLLDA